MQISKKRSKLIEIFIVIFLLIIVFIIAILTPQASLFFYPWNDEKSYNELLKLDDFKEININNNGKKLSGWLKYNTQNEKSPLLIFCGGNYQNSSNTCISFKENNIYSFFDGYNILIVDYPGFGFSEGKPSDKTMFDSILKIYDYATTELDCVDNNNIVVLGYSIGTGVATYLASQRNVNGLILIAPYDNALSLYNANLNIFHGPLKLLAKYKFNSILYAQSVKVSPLIITSHSDEVINYQFSLNLANYFDSVEKTIVLDNIKHNDYFSESTVLENIFNYLQERL